MKTFRKIFSLAVGVILLFGCGETTDPIKTNVASIVSDAELITKEIEQNLSKTTFLLTDAPSDEFKSVIVDIKSPIVITMDGKTVDVPLPDNEPIRVDLLELNEISEALGGATLPAGTITKIKLNLANPKIVLLDDTVLDASGIDFTPVLEITLATPITVPSDGTGAMILLDFDVENSIKIDVSGGVKPIFRPTGGASPVDEQQHPDGVEARNVNGTVAEIPGIKGNSESFLLKHRGRRLFIHVDANGTTTEIYKFNGEGMATTTFRSLEKGQKVEVGGFFTKGILKAKKVVILPENHRGIRGVITHLNQSESGLHTFDLLLLKHDLEVTDSDRAIATTTATTTTRTTIKVQYSPEKVHILLNHPHMKLSSGDLTNGQMVFVGGLYKDDLKAIQAHVIIVKSDQVRGFIAEEPNCTDKLIRIIHPFKEHRRLLAAGIDLQPHNSGMVDISEAKIFRLEGTKIDCGALRRGMAVKIFGKMVPHIADTVDPNPVRLKAFDVKVVPVHHVGGKVLSVFSATDDRGATMTVLRLAMPIDRVEGFDRPASAVCTTTAFDCNHFTIRVILSPLNHNPDGIVFDKELVGRDIRAAGYFAKALGRRVNAVDSSEEATAEIPNFLAIVVRNGEPSKGLVSPID